MVTIPRLATEHLVLRSFAPEDFEPYPEMMANPEVAQYLGEGRPLDRAEAWRQMSMLLGHWELRGFGLWAVEKRSTGRVYRPHRLPGTRRVSRPSKLPMCSANQPGAGLRPRGRGRRAAVREGSAGPHRDHKHRPPGEFGLDPRSHSARWPTNGRVLRRPIGALPLPEEVTVPQGGHSLVGYPRHAAAQDPTNRNG